MYKLVRSLVDWQNNLDSTKPIFCDTETCEEVGKTSPKKGLYGNIRLIQIYQVGWKEAIIFDCFFIELEQVLDIIKPFHLVFHNASYDIHTINCHTDILWLPDKIDDSFYLSKLTYPDKIKFDFYSCLKYAKLTDGIINGMDKKENQTADWSLSLTNDMLKYAACDVLYLSLLWDSIQDYIDTEVYKLDIDNLKYSIEYDRIGLPINIKTISKLQQQAIVDLEIASSEIPVNINSSKQCCEWLNVSSSGKEELGILKLKGSEDAGRLMKARAAYKLLGFLKNYKVKSAKSFHNSCGARTGRMTCSGGDRYFYNNNQNPPRALFPAIEAPPGKLIIYKDYAGLELRMAVAWVGEPTMAALMKSGEDLHTSTGCILFNCTPETLPSYKRIITKFYNFGTAYGAGVATLRSLLMSQGQIDISFKEVKQLKDKWLEMYPYFSEWHNIHKKVLQVYGYIDIITALGRPIRAYTFTDSLNFPIQGSSSEVTKLAVHYLYERYITPDIINVVHDSIALLKPEKEAELWIARLNECMIDAWYYVIKDLAIPDLPMPAEAEAKLKWIQQK